MKNCILCKTNVPSNVSLFAFPREKETREAWLNFCSLKVESISSNSRLCSQHFTPESISKINESSGRRTIKKDAVPSVKIAVTKQTSLMKKSCFLCGNRDHASSYFSFRKEWASFCEVLIHKKDIPKNGRLCSQHFQESDIIDKGGRRFLKNGTKPSIYVFDEEEMHYTASLMSSPATTFIEELNYPASIVTPVTSADGDNSNTTSLIATPEYVQQRT